MRADFDGRAYLILQQADESAGAMEVNAASDSKQKIQVETSRSKDSQHERM